MTNCFLIQCSILGILSNLISMVLHTQDFSRSQVLKLHHFKTIIIERHLFFACLLFLPLLSFFLPFPLPFALSFPPSILPSLPSFSFLLPLPFSLSLSFLLLRKKSVNGADIYSELLIGIFPSVCHRHTLFYNNKN